MVARPAFPLTRFKQTITVNMTYLCRLASRELQAKMALCILFEHMLFKGTPKHTNIPAELTFARSASERFDVA